MGFMPMLWWGRLGKLAQLAAGLIILVDLLGKKRMEKYAKATVGRYEDDIRVLHLRPYQVALYYIIWLSISVGGIVAVFTLLLSRIGWPVSISLSLVFIALGRFIAGMVFVQLFAAIRLLARSLKPEHPVRWFSFYLALVGFHFDLLAS